MFNALGTNREWPTSVLYALGVGKVVSLAQRVGATLPDAVTVPLPDKPSVSDPMMLQIRAGSRRKREREADVAALSSDVISAWAGYLSSVVTAAVTDPSILGDLLELIDDPASPYTMCLSDEVACALHTLVQTVADDANTPISTVELVLRLAGAVVRTDIACSPPVPLWCYKPETIYRRGSVPQPALLSVEGTPSMACTQAMVEGGLVNRSCRMQLRLHTEAERYLVEDLPRLREYVSYDTYDALEQSLSRLDYTAYGGEGRFGRAADPVDNLTVWEIEQAMKRRTGTDILRCLAYSSLKMGPHPPSCILCLSDTEQEQLQPYIYGLHRRQSSIYPAVELSESMMSAVHQLTQDQVTAAVNGVMTDSEAPLLRFVISLLSSGEY
ncbi:hypothetical protein KIPB_001751 [Kipferlia bialata]|uniref:Uncharacterized protein n=1 Tax=Kipferlia bialata TaxID=797122 RepID=A0A9K3GFC8_9EUKA|nr:hypothetical protein KIPB_001751 [Kipferlia bialata]|eukprot:g1751.t1